MGRAVLDATDTCCDLRLTAATLKRLVNEGHIPYRRLGKTYLSLLIEAREAIDATVRVVPILALGLLVSGCVLDWNKGSADRQKPTVVFAMPPAWRCARQTQTLPTTKGTLEACRVCQNIARTVQGVTINKEAHTVAPQGSVAMCESSAFVMAEGPQ